MENTKTVISTLLEALPYIKKFRGETIVIKYGGAAQIDEALKDAFARDIVLLNFVGIKVVVVHGGGPKITSMLDRLQISSEFVNGHRVTSKDAMEVVEMVLSGSINKSIVALLNSHGAKAIGINGKDFESLQGKPKNPDDPEDFTGEVTLVNTKIIENLLHDGLIPVIAPIASGGEVGHPGFNINADMVASAIAIALNARKVLFLTDTAGVLDKDKKLLTKLDKTTTNALKEDGTIYGGMLPKVDACLRSIAFGAKEAHIIDGRVEHAVLLELMTTQGVGTIIEQ